MLIRFHSSFVENTDNICPVQSVQRPLGSGPENQVVPTTWRYALRRLWPAYAPVSMCMDVLGFVMFNGFSTHLTYFKTSQSRV